MKKVILSSVFAGLVMMTSSVDAKSETKSEKAAYGKFVINAGMAAGYWANLYHDNTVTGVEDGIDDKDFTKRHIISLSDANIKFTTEGGCSAVTFGAVAKLEMNAAKLNRELTGKDDYSGIFRDTYVYGRFANMIEIRIGMMRDALWAFESAESIQGGSQGYDGYYGSLLAGTSLGKSTRKERWVLKLDHKNDTGYTNALDIRTTRLAGFQGVFNFKPSEAYRGRLDTYGNGKRSIGALNNIISGGVSYDNKFGDWRFRADAAAIYAGAKKDAADNANPAEQADNFAYQANAVVSWNGLDVAIGWLDNRSSGFSGVHKEKNAGKAFHGGVAYQFDSVMWKPRVSAGALFGWKNGSNDMDLVANEFKNQDATLTFCASVDLNIRDGFRWFVEGAFAMLDEKNSPLMDDKDFSEKNVIIGTGLAVSQ